MVRAGWRWATGCLKIDEARDSGYVSRMGYLYSAFVVGVAIAIKGVIEAWWWGLKEREAKKPQVMKMNRKGVYVPWGIVQKIERGINIWLVIWVVYIIGLVAILIYVKLIA